MDDGDALIHLVNEYSGVKVGVDRSYSGPRLSLRSDRTGDAIALDASALEAIASMDQAAIGRLVAAFSETGNAGDAVVGP